MRVLVIGDSSAYTRQLIEALKMYCDVTLVYADDALTGKRIETVIVDDYLMREVATLYGFNSIESPLLETDGRRRRSKGDKHRNRRYRWAE